MKAQHGTLNFKEDGIYMVLSLPASVFDRADEDNDNLLSMTEFSQQRTEIIKTVTEFVTFTSKEQVYRLQNVLVSPVTPHDSPKAPAEQIVAMGKFVLTDKNQPLQFAVELFGNNPEEHVLHITASKKSENQKQKFELTPKAYKKELDIR